MANDDTTFMTTRELAELLRISERKVYDLVATQAVPHTKATGKLLFSRGDISRWLASQSNNQGQMGGAQPMSNHLLPNKGN